MIRSVVYRSMATAPFATRTDFEILETAWRRNRIMGVTGYLVRSEGAYVQYLEGAPDALDALLASIEGDTRHTHFEMLQDTAIGKRRFANWAMGYHADMDKALEQNLAAHDDPRFPIDSIIGFMQALARLRETGSASCPVGGPAH